MHSAMTTEPHGTASAVLATRPPTLMLRKARGHGTDARMLAVMRQWWLEKACPWWASGDVPAEVRNDPLALQAYGRLSRDLMRTPTDYPLSAAQE